MCQLWTVTCHTNKTTQNIQTWMWYNKQEECMLNCNCNIYNSELRTTILVRFLTQSHCHHGCQFHIFDFTISSHLSIVNTVVQFYVSSLPVVITDIYSVSYVVILYLYILHFIMYSNCSLHFSPHHKSYLHFGLYLLS
jgi:hypothetical protein